MPNWKRLQQLNAGEAIWYSDPQLDTKDEVWFYNQGGALRIWSEGTLHKEDPKVFKGLKPVERRHTLYRLSSLLHVDVEVRGEQSLICRGTLNGAHLVSRIETSRIEALLARYRKLGFKDGAPWNASAKYVTRREYHLNDSKYWDIRVDGEHVFEDYSKQTTLASREAALARAEQRVRAREKAGFQLRNIELEKARFSNPEPKPAPGAPKRAPPPKGPAFPKPQDAFEAVDTAIAMLKDLHTRYPTGHFVAEQLDVAKEKKRIASVEEHASFFKRMHKERIGRWQTAKPGKPKKRESSWDYFLRVYGSITWIVGSGADDDLPMFLCGNVTGGGWSCLEVSNDLYEMDDLVEATGNTDLEELLVFHGGWHTRKSFAFDCRVASPSGELAIIPFDESIEKLPRPMKPERVQPFGTWLHKRVSELIRTAEANLHEAQ
ncbi:hypothetical protein [Archangium violaceum]|uniref:hypothetical protein n=1 Tax=Archangium violaceum TaxID=83451 RepID=UPI001EF41FE5|nr:hypothetical protein [Archangium violaceum]